MRTAPVCLSHPPTRVVVASGLPLVSQPVCWCLGHGGRPKFGWPFPPYRVISHIKLNVMCDNNIYATDPDRSLLSTVRLGVRA